MAPRISYIEQTRFFDPDEPISPDNYGNCFQAAIASLFDKKSIEDVPDFLGNELKGGENWFIAFMDWMHSRGYDVRIGPANSWLDPRIPYVATGPSFRSETSHACIYRAGELEWDPYPSERRRTYDSTVLGTLVQPGLRAITEIFYPVWPGQ